MDPQSPINDQERQEDNMSSTTNPNPDQEMPATTSPVIDIDFTLISPLFWDVEDDHIVKVSRELRLFVRQKAGRACSGVSRRLRVKHIPKGTGAALGFRTTHSPEEVGKAKSELQAVLGNFSSENQWQKVKLVRPKVRADEMELKVWAQTMVRVEKMEDSTLDAERDTNVFQKYGKKYMLHAGERESQGEESVRLAREEIGGALDTMRIIYGETFEGFEWPGKEGVELEDWKGCEHCGKKERNGDCLYPRDMLDQLADGTIDLTEARAQVNGRTAAKYYNQAW